MPCFELPDCRDLREAPQLATLALLDAALLVVDQTLRLEHSELKAQAYPLPPDNSPEVLLAALLAERIRELRALIAAHLTNVRHAGQHIPF
jgi:hypothetical protein